MISGLVLKYLKTFDVVIRQNYASDLVPSSLSDNTVERYKAVSICKLFHLYTKRFSPLVRWFSKIFAQLLFLNFAHGIAGQGVDDHDVAGVLEPRQIFGDAGVDRVAI